MIVIVVLVQFGDLLHKTQKGYSITTIVNKINKRARLLRIYISQLDNLISKNQENTSLFFENFSDLEDFNKAYKEGPEKAKSVLLEIHQMCENQISDFLKQTDVIVKFAPEVGSHIKEHIESLKETTSDFLNTINTPITKNQSESFYFTQSMKFLETVSEMQQTTNVIAMLIITASNVAEYTLEFLENN